MKTFKIISITSFACIAIVFLIGILNPVKPDIITRTVIDRDTIIVVDYRTPDPIYIEREVIVYDTIYVATSGDSIETEVATLDTTFEDSARLEVSYYITPRVYDISYYAPPVESKTVTIKELETVYVDSSAWWDNAIVGGVAGSLFTGLIVSLVK